MEKASTFYIRKDYLINKFKLNILVDTQIVNDIFEKSLYFFYQSEIEDILIKFFIDILYASHITYVNLIRNQMESKTAIDYIIIYKRP